MLARNPRGEDEPLPRCEALVLLWIDVVECVGVEESFMFAFAIRAVWANEATAPTATEDKGSGNCEN